MEITQAGAFLVGKLRDKSLSEEDRIKLCATDDTETAEEFMELAEEAESLADPAVLFGVCTPAEGSGYNVRIGGTDIHSTLVREKLSGPKRCFPFIATCGTALEVWSKQYKGDLLSEFWTEEIKKHYLNRISAAFFRYLKEYYRATGHLTALNPGSLKDWPLTGQQELFRILGGPEYVKTQIGVHYTDSFLMLPFKSISGIAFESEAFYENCQYCPLSDCPNRRAPRKTEDGTPCTH